MNSSYFNTAAGAFLGIVFVLMTLSIVSDGIYHAAEPETEGFVIEVAESASDAGDAGEDAAPEMIEPLLASADPAKGETVFKKCAACHTNDSGGANKVGPGLWNVVNRPVASHEGFNYSNAMVEFSEGGSVEWSYDQLNNFLEAPKKHIPGTSMGFAGLKKIDDRANILAYLRTLADTPAPLPAEAAPEVNTTIEDATAVDDAPADDAAAEDAASGDAAAEEAPAAQGTETTPSE